MAEERKITGPSYEVVKAFQEVFEERQLRGLWTPDGPVWGLGIGIIKDGKGRERFAINVHLDIELTDEALKRHSLPKRFRRIPVVYERTGPIVAAAAT